MIRFFKGLLCNYGLTKHLFGPVGYDSFFGLYFKQCTKCSRIYQTSSKGVEIAEL